MTDLTGNTFFEGPAGRIEAIIKEPAGPVARAAIVCHPHPLFGGTMHNKVVFRIARAFQNAGFAVLRFNFRGAGGSEGEHDDDGLGEQADLRAAIDFINQRYPGAEVWLAGFSFGSTVMLRAAACDDRVRALVAAGVPVSKYDFSRISRCNKPKLFVQGSLDQFGPAQDLERFFATLDEPKEMQFIEGADHFFEGGLDKLGEAISHFIASIDSGGRRPQPFLTP
jgi:alpha/beta superfamily hydrolase